MLLRETDRQIGLIYKLTSCIRYSRYARYTDHELSELLVQRIY